jgi:nitroreductase
MNKKCHLCLDVGAVADIDNRMGNAQLLWQGKITCLENGLPDRPESDARPQRNEAVIEFMKNRRSVPSKTMAGPGPDRDELAQIMQIAARVPDHGKIAPWRFVELSAKTRILIGEKIARRALERNPDMNEEALEFERLKLNRAPTVIALIFSPHDHPKVPVWEQELSCGAVGMNFLIAANAFGYDAQWLTEWMAFDPELGGLFDVREGERLAGFIHIGTRTMPKTDRERPDLAAIHTIL